jgi:hypothetical protein
MAVASLLLSFVSVIVPFGIAAVVMGHVSRNQIAKSGGRLGGHWLAFSALVVGYIQLGVAAILLLVAWGVFREMDRDLRTNPYLRAALVERILYGDPNRVTKADAARQNHYLLEALRLIRTRQRDYLAAHPDQGYACRLDQLGYQPTVESELRALIVNSRFDVRLYKWG